MKTVLRFFVLLLIFLPAAIKANLLVKGQVTYVNGQPANNYQIYIQSDSSDIGCNATHVKYTNIYGNYLDTLVCGGTIKHVTVWLKDCGNNLVYKYLAVPTSGIVEANFVVCINVQCHVDYALSGNGATKNFVVQNAQAGNATAHIIRYEWNFGDGTPIVSTTNTSLSHTFISGYFPVCLTMTTSDSCQSTACHTISVISECLPIFTWAPVANAIDQVKFNSLGSRADSLGLDSIVSRKWVFGDGDTLVGNRIDPTHQYLTAGNYTVCLTIKTLYGCEHSICQTVHAGNYTLTCHAQFNIENVPQPSSTGFIVRFNNIPSVVAPGDSIKSSIWTFGDGTSLAGNVPNPLHSYAKPGTYTACLKIISTSGCTDSICKPIVVLPLHCVASFNWSPPTVAAAPLINVHFQSNTSHAAAGYDSIIARRWVFGDSTTLGGNAIDPTHTFPKPGNCRVCLFIQTATGCTDSICENVMVTAPNGDTVHHDFIRVGNVYPNPATTQFNTIIWSMYNNVNATLAIYDVYGTLKWMQKTLLVQGNNNISVPLSQLTAGPYIFKVTTMYGVSSKTFFKM